MYSWCELSVLTPLYNLHTDFLTTHQRPNQCSQSDFLFSWFRCVLSRSHQSWSSHLPLALLYYDFILTLPLEAERFWASRQSWVSTFLYLNRYTALLFHIPVIYEYFYVMPESVSTQTFLTLT